QGPGGKGDLAEVRIRSPPVRAGPEVKSLRTAAGRWDGGALCPLHGVLGRSFDRWSGAGGWLSTASRFFFHGRRGSVHGDPGHRQRRRRENGAGGGARGARRG